MFLIPCRILFEGGPHDGLFADWDFIPDQQMIVPANSRWRDECEMGSVSNLSAPGWKAIYLWRNTQFVGPPSDPEILLRYRFLTFHAQLPSATSGARKTFGGYLRSWWRSITTGLRRIRPLEYAPGSKITTTLRRSTDCQSESPQAD